MVSELLGEAMAQLDPLGSAYGPSCIYVLHRCTPMTVLSLPTPDTRAVKIESLDGVIRYAWDASQMPFVVVRRPARRPRPRAPSAETAPGGDRPVGLPVLITPVRV